MEHPLPPRARGGGHGGADGALALLVGDGAGARRGHPAGRALGRGVRGGGGAGEGVRGPRVRDVRGVLARVAAAAGRRRASAEGGGGGGAVGGARGGGAAGGRAGGGGGGGREGPAAGAGAAEGGRAAARLLPAAAAAVPLLLEHRLLRGDGALRGGLHLPRDAREEGLHHLHLPNPGAEEAPVRRRRVQQRPLELEPPDHLHAEQRRGHVRARRVVPQPLVARVLLRRGHGVRRRRPPEVEDLQVRRVKLPLPPVERRPELPHVCGSGWGRGEAGKNSG